MNASEKITEYIAKYQDWRGGVLEQLRKTILDSDSEITEEWKWNSPVWSYNGLLCSASAFKKHVGLNFFQGASLEDRTGLFNSGLDSKKTRSINFQEGDKIDEKALGELIKTAIRFNRK